ncbi:host-nuclease inhibitor Gam family protein [uncultured Desulfovibrio sp.]|uniref:host-nuclease inhibitor Gam family protein n=1 Tax=uncultured Desulfovibrio sp. TaxID=167968 RepID=UPI00039ABBAE|nr:host-nuclease inhibitor Gam family protein [uncultured Desulfovibrio sp.]
MTKRVKPVLQIPAINSLEEADAVLAEIAGRKRLIALHEIQLKEDVDRLKAKCAAQCEPLKQDIAQREQALVQFGIARKEELFRGKKSLSLNFGTIGFRASSALKTAKKLTWERVLGLIKEKGLPCVRVKEEVDKEALRSLSAEKLAEVGCKLEQTDDFFYEINEAELADSPPVS